MMTMPDDGDTSGRPDATPDTAPSSDGPAPHPAGGGDPLRQCVTIANQRGLHARAAAKFVKLASTFNCDVQVRRGETIVCGVSIMGLMMLAAGIGTTIELRTAGPDAENALASLASLVLRKFDED